MLLGRVDGVAGMKPSDRPRESTQKGQKAVGVVTGAHSKIQTPEVRDGKSDAEGNKNGSRQGDSPTQRKPSKDTPKFRGTQGTDGTSTSANSAVGSAATNQGTAESGRTATSNLQLPACSLFGARKGRTANLKAPACEETQGAKNGRPGLSGEVADNSRRSDQAREVNEASATEGSDAHETRAKFGTNGKSSVKLTDCQFQSSRRKYSRETPQAEQAKAARQSDPTHKRTRGRATIEAQAGAQTCTHRGSRKDTPPLQELSLHEVARGRSIARRQRPLPQAATAQGHEHLRLAAPSEADEPLEYAVLDALQHVQTSLAKRMLRSLKFNSQRTEKTERMVLKLQAQLEEFAPPLSPTRTGDSSPTLISDSTAFSDFNVRQQSDLPDAAATDAPKPEAATGEKKAPGWQQPARHEPLSKFHCALLIFACVLWLVAAAILLFHYAGATPSAAPYLSMTSAGNVILNGTSVFGAGKIFASTTRAPQSPEIELQLQTQDSNNGKAITDLAELATRLSQESRVCQAATAELRAQLLTLRSGAASGAHGPCKAGRGSATGGQTPVPKKEQRVAVDALGRINEQKALIARLEKERRELQQELASRQRHSLQRRSTSEQEL